MAVTGEVERRHADPGARERGRPLLLFRQCPGCGEHCYRGLAVAVTVGRVQAQDAQDGLDHVLLWFGYGGVFGHRGGLGGVAVVEQGDDGGLAAVK